MKKKSHKKAIKKKTSQGMSPRTKYPSNKTSKLYKKKYRGQGRS